MGKIVSVIQFTGRTGNLVGSKGQNGTVVLKNHQPNVTNRNTQEQVNARVKLALAGSLSKIVPADTIYGMTGDGNRGRRQRWIKAIMALVMMVYAAKYIGSTPTAILGALEPTTAVLIGVFVFGEPFSLRLLLGIILILAAVTIVVLGKARRTQSV